MLPVAKNIALVQNTCSCCQFSHAARGLTPKVVVLAEQHTKDYEQAHSVANTAVALAEQHKGEHGTLCTSLKKFSSSSQAIASHTGVMLPCCSLCSLWGP